LPGLAIVISAIICGAIFGAAVALIKDLPQIRSLESYRPSATTKIYTSDNMLLAELYKENRNIVPLDEIPILLQKALIATEDRQFYNHSGIDIKGIMRAIFKDIISGKFVQGASTITQQLSKTLFLTPEKTIERKLKEAFLSFQLERRYTKDEILALYLNQVYFGSGAYGVESAARKFFNKPVKDLLLEECALIAGLPKAPSVYSPLVNPDLAIKRRNIVLKQMHTVGIITQNQIDLALKTPFIPPAKKKGVTKAPYFVDYIKKILEKEIGDSALYQGGLTVFTTLSYKMQNIAEPAVEKGMASLKNRMTRNKISDPDPQCALIAIDVQTGGILAMVGGSDYSSSSFNRATSARRQPGSAFKPIVYALAIENGFSQSMLLLDSPVAFKGAKKANSGALKISQKPITAKFLLEGH